MKFVPVCCFCGKDVKKKSLDPLSVAIFAQGAKEDNEQTFWAHIACFVKRLYDKSIMSEALGGPKINYVPVQGKEKIRIEKLIAKLRQSKK